jgi:lysophospholipase L1-like esterase
MQRMLVVALLFLGLASCRSEAAPPEPLRVACVGDSITEGNANADHARNAWPLILQRMLDQAFPRRYRVGNFGRSGATALAQGTRPYQDEGVYEQGLAFAPDVVIVNLGTNDATPRNWPEHGDAFAADYAALVDAFAGLSPPPEILLSNLSPQLPPYPHGEENVPYRAAVDGLVAELAARRGLAVIDFHAPLAGETKLIPDGVHPNTAGNARMAAAAFRALTGEQAPDDPTLQPRAVEGEPEDLLRLGARLPAAGEQWPNRGSYLEGTGQGNRLHAQVSLGAGDFQIRARLRMEGQLNSAAGFFLDGAFFGFEGARGTLFRNLPGLGLRLLHPSPVLFERGAWIDFELIRNGDQIWFLIDGFVADMALIDGPVTRFGFEPSRSTMQVAEWTVVGELQTYRPEPLVRRTVACPWIDLSRRDDLVTRSGQRLAPEPSHSSTTRLARASDERWVELIAQRSEHGNSLAVGGADASSANSRYELPKSLTGEQHVAAVAPDGRWVIAFLDTAVGSPTRGDWVAWLGSHDDLVMAREGDLTVRLVDPGEGPAGTPRLSVGDDDTIRFALDDLPAGGSTSVRFSLDDVRALLPTRGYDLPVIDLDGDAQRHVVVDREPGQYLGHPTTCLLEDGHTMLCVFPKGHGRGPVVYHRSDDGGRTWSERLPTPESWATSKEVPTLHRVIDPVTGEERLIMWSGLYPARLAVSEDDGATWGELEPAGDWGGIVVMGFVERLADGRYLAMFHDDGRFFSEGGRTADPVVFTLYQTISQDGGLSWSFPEVVWSGSDLHLCEPGCVRSPDGSTLAVLLRENSRRRNAYVIFSEDEGASWSAPRELPASLTGDRHTGKYGPDGRLFLSFRDRTHDSPTWGDWVGWVGTFDDILHGTEGQYRVRIKDNTKSADTAYPGVEILPDGTFVTTTYGHWDEGEEPYILASRFTFDELDAKARDLPRKQDLFAQGMGGVHTYRIPALVTSNAGTLVACVDARVPHSGDLPNDIDTVVRRSTDGGRTWGPVLTVLDHDDGVGTADPCLLVDRDTGRIWMAVTWADGVNWRQSQPGYGDDSFHTLLLHSDDDGLSWSAPRDVTAQLKHPSWRSAWFSPGAGLQTRSGRLLLPYSVADGEGAGSSWVAVSDDHGDSWRRVGPMGTGTNECMLVQLASGTVMCNLRSTQGTGFRAVALSEDDGETWGELVHDERLPEPVCQASLLTVPAEATPDGREWLLFLNPASDERENLTLRMSPDGGRTWPVARTLHAGATAYSCLTLLPDGGVGALYERGSDHAYEGMTFARIPLAWLVDDGAAGG